MVLEKMSQYLKEKILLYYYTTFGITYAELNSNPILSEMNEGILIFKKQSKLVELLDVENQNYTYKQLRNNLNDMYEDFNYDIDFLNGVLANYDTLAMSGFLFNNEPVKNVEAFKKKIKDFNEFLVGYNKMFKTSMLSLNGVIREKDSNKMLELFENFTAETQNSYDDVLNTYTPFNQNDKTVSNLKEILRLYTAQNNSNLQDFKTIVEKANNIENVFTSLKETALEAENTKNLLENEQRAKEIENQKIEIEKQKEAKEAERIAMIDKANDLFDRLCEDFMRDLQKQVPYSAKAQYEEFVNVKFKEFMKEYRMPLSKRATIKEAKDVCKKINGLFDDISKISSESYVIEPIKQ